jgi:hypothetical protein
MPPSTIENLAALRKKVEKQIGCSLETSRGSSNLLLLIYRQIMGLSVRIKELERKEQVNVVAEDLQKKIKQISSTEEYKNFIKEIDDPIYRTSIVSSIFIIILHKLQNMCKIYFERSKNLVKLAAVQPKNA